MSYTAQAITARAAPVMSSLRRRVFDMLNMFFVKGISPVNGSLCSWEPGEIQKVSESSLTSLRDRVSHVVAPASATNRELETTMTNNDNRPRTNLDMAIDWSLDRE